jgi:hypothetical protein
MAPLSALLFSKDHKLDIKSLPPSDASADRFAANLPKHAYVWPSFKTDTRCHALEIPNLRTRVLLGVPTIDAIVQALAERGIRGTAPMQSWTLVVPPSCAMAKADPHAARVRA